MSPRDWSREITLCLAFIALILALLLSHCGGAEVNATQPNACETCAGGAIECGGCAEAAAGGVSCICCEPDRAGTFTLVVQPGSACLDGGAP